jgi:phage terminase large subunit GpA-like protein
VDWSTVAAQFLDSKDNIPDLQNFNHSWLAEPQDVSRKEIKESDLKDALYQPYLRGEVPADVIAITAGADTGDSDIHVTYVGWGANGEHWKIYSCQFKGDNFFNALAKFEKEWRREFQFKGQAVPISGGAMDSGGHNAEAIYRFCARNPQWIATHGHGRTGSPYVVSRVMVGKKGEQRPLGINLYTYWDSYFQDIMQGYLTRGRGEGPGFAHVPENCSEVWLKHAVNEVKKMAPDRDGHIAERWVARFSGAAIHYRDSYKLAIFRAHTLNYHRMRPRAVETTQESEQIPRVKQQNRALNRGMQPLSNRI